MRQHRLQGGFRYFGHDARCRANISALPLPSQSPAPPRSGFVQFLSFTHALDLGAGPGIFGIAVCAAHPSLRCVCFDRLEVSRVCAEVVTEYGVEDCVIAKAGDYMTDDIGHDYDFIMANFTLNFYRDRLPEVMQKVLGALKPGGVFMVTSDGLNANGTEPAATVLSWLPTTLMGSDMSFRTGEIARAILASGFVSTEQKTLTDCDLEAHSPIEMTIGRKARAPSSSTYSDSTSM